ncbi:putative thiol peroxidase [Chitiniphilus shinanonensis]|uniref:Thiol peroxidase n=1 Tax=Chitiniphilus shinanonensis TaxID=553088 RepID=A0ABQ6BS98_9NEIS|nr:thiol peroxidase [Chitiniphilus shinanonensis]GLS04499.1 putative thiol peroxidase [Chitiniphilus shinanonensis]
MATVMLNGTPISVGGRFPRTGDTASSFMLVDVQLQDVPLSKFWGRRKVIAVVPSVDAAIGLTIARSLESLAPSWENTVVLLVSVDTPYAMQRLLHQEDFRNFQLLSTLRGRDFHKDYGVMITDIPLSGLMATALIALDVDDTVRYAELVQDINSEPNYEAMIQALIPPPPEPLLEPGITPVA